MQHATPNTQPDSPTPNPGQQADRPVEFWHGAMQRAAAAQQATADARAAQARLAGAA